MAEATAVRITAAQLIASLSKCPQDAPIYMAIDKEGSLITPMNHVTRNDELFIVIVWPGAFAEIPQAER